MGSPLLLRLRTSVFSGGVLGSLGIGGASGAAIPATFFGMHVNNLPSSTIWGDYDIGAASSYKQTPFPTALGCGSTRMWDMDGCSWRNINRSNGAYTWDRFDQCVVLLKEANQKVIYTLGCGPDWATTQAGQKPGMYVGYNPWPPADNAYWTAWCTAVATRFVNAGLRGVAYEIWNEVNDNANGTGAVGSGYTGTTAQLVTLTQLARSAIKAVDPTAIIVSPNFTEQGGIIYSGTGSTVTLENFILAGGAAYCDVIAVHGYNTLNPWTKPEGLIPLASTITGLLARNSITLPVWNTEWGWGEWIDSTGAFRSGGSGTAAPDAMSAAMGAAYMARMILLSWLCGFQRFGFYTFDSFAWSSILLCDAATRTSLLAPALAFQYLRTLLVGGYLSGLQQLSDGSGVSYWTATFTTATGRSGKVYWCQDYQTASIALSSAKGGTDCLGNALTLGSSLTVTSSPQFLFQT